MSNLFFGLYLEKMDWNSDDYKTEVTHLKAFEIADVLVTEKTINDLHIEIIQAKGDWLNFNTNVVEENYYIQTNLIFHSMDLSEEDEQIINKVIGKCESFFQVLKRLDAATRPSNFELLDKILDEDGFVIKAHEGGGWGVAEDLTQLLSSQNMSFKTIRHQKSRFDGGASGGFEEILLFIGGAASSGITWDILKGLFTNRFGIELENIKATFVDSMRFKQLRRNIADRIVEDHKDLILIDFYNQESEIICEFKIYGIIEKTITVLCDSEYQIKELKLERK
ncbi:hypothetical protein ACFTRD_03875 [Paenibacillus sp. NPDC056933]|uniref:hypothetical protein n=1 Tax=Paenibacillus sp. NPDC056933 TaxID=3345968 RepID=UPI0036388056